MQYTHMITRRARLDIKMTMSSVLCAIAHLPLWCSNGYRDAPYYKPSQHSSHVCAASQATAGLATSQDSGLVPSLIPGEGLGGGTGFTLLVPVSRQGQLPLAPRETWTAPWVTSPASGTLLREDGHGDHSQEYTKG